MIYYSHQPQARTFTASFIIQFLVEKVKHFCIINILYFMHFFNNYYLLHEILKVNIPLEYGAMSHSW